jgi:SAM-dependent methyltransferase
MSQTIIDTGATEMDAATRKANELVRNIVAALAAVQPEGRIDWLLKTLHHPSEREVDMGRANATLNAPTDDALTTSSQSPYARTLSDLEADHTGKYVCSDLAVMRVVSLLVAVPGLVRGRRVLELGCGLGALGHVCAALEANAVVSTDGEESTVALARATAAKLPAHSTAFLGDEGSDNIPTVISSSEIDFFTLRWGDAAALETLCSNGSSSSSAGGGNFELIVGNELMYYATPVDALVATVAAALRRSSAALRPEEPPACAVISHFFRRAGLPIELVVACESHGLACLDLTLPGAERDTCRSQLLCWASDVEAVQCCLPAAVNPRPLAQVIAEEEATDDIERHVGGFDYDPSIFE